MNTATPSSLPRRSNPPDGVLRVKASSNVNSTAAKIAYTIEEDMRRTVEVRAMGAGSVNQAVKAIAVARGILASKAYDLTCKIGFDKVVGDTDDSVSVIVFRLIVL